MAPGQTDNHGTTLKHFFDGDAFLSGYSFRDGQVTLRAAFINTPEREQEIEAGRMIYGEFGTLPPAQDPPGRIQFKKPGATSTSSITTDVCWPCRRAATPPPQTRPASAIRGAGTSTEPFLPTSPSLPIQSSIQPPVKPSATASRKVLGWP